MAVVDDNRSHERGLNNSAELFIDGKDKQFADIQVGDEIKYKNCNDDCIRLFHGLRIEHAALLHEDERTSNMLREVEENTMQSYRQVWQGRHAIDSELRRLAEEKADEVNTVYDEELRSQKEATVFTKQIGGEICNLYSDLEKARSFRAAKNEKLAEAVRTKLDEVRLAITAEHRMRLQSESTLLELFGDMGQKMQKELDASRQERHAATDRLIGFLEEILPALDRSRFAGKKEETEMSESKSLTNALLQHQKRFYATKSKTASSTTKE